MTDEGEALLKNVFTTFGEFSFLFVEEIGDWPKVTAQIGIDDISEDMMLTLGSVTSVTLTSKKVRIISKNHHSKHRPR